MSREALREHATRIRNMLASGVTTAPVVYVQNVPQVQARLSSLELVNLQMVELSGHGSNLPVGTPILAVFLGGDRSNGVIIGSTSPKGRPALTGLQDASLFGYGFNVTILADGVHIIGNTFLTGNLAVTGNITATGSIIAGLGGADQVNLQTHKHPANNTAPTAGT